MDNIKDKTFHIVVIGCQMNKSDSERIAGYMELNGFKRTSREKAAYVFITTCGVRQSAEDRVYGLVPKIKKENPGVKIILTGCLSERSDVRRRLKGGVDIWLSISDLPKLAEKIGIKQEQLKSESYLNIAPNYSSKFTAFVPIGNGCNNFCTYCVVPYARGREVYRPVKEILDEIEKLVKNGYKEINLIAQNVNSYISSDSEKIKFPELLRRINRIEGDYWIRFATSHPKDMSDELIDAVADNDKMCNHIHLPVQSGDNEVLKNMNRKYTVEHYLGLIKKIRDKIPDCSITTDVIVGFPGETEEQFNNTAKLFEKVEYDMGYVSRFSPRFGTAAINLEDDVSREEKRRRDEVLVNIIKKTGLENNKKYIRNNYKVLLHGKNKKGKFFGYTGTNKTVMIDEWSECDKSKIGEFVNVKINSSSDFGLNGKIL